MPTRIEIEDLNNLIGKTCCSSKFWTIDNDVIDPKKGLRLVYDSEWGVVCSAEHDCQETTTTSTTTTTTTTTITITTTTTTTITTTSTTTSTISTTTAPTTTTTTTTTTSTTTAKKTTTTTGSTTMTTTPIRTTTTNEKTTTKNPTPPSSTDKPTTPDSGNCNHRCSCSDGCDTCRLGKQCKVGLTTCVNGCVTEYLGCPVGELKGKF